MWVCWGAKIRWSPSGGIRSVSWPHSQSWDIFSFQLKLFLSVGSILWSHVNNGVSKTREFRVFGIRWNCGIRSSCLYAEEKKAKATLLYRTVVNLRLNLMCSSSYQKATKLKGRSQKSPGPEHWYKSRRRPRDDSKPSLLEELKEDIEDAEDNR